MSSPYFLYVLRCNDASLYTGIARDVQKRFKVHSQKKGSKYVAARLPAKIVYLEGPFETVGDAMRRERAIKKLSRTQKEDLISEFPDAAVPRV